VNKSLSIGIQKEPYTKIAMQQLMLVKKFEGSVWSVHWKSWE